MKKKIYIIYIYGNNKKNIIRKPSPNHTTDNQDICMNNKKYR